MLKLTTTEANVIVHALESQIQQFDQYTDYKSSLIEEYEELIDKIVQSEPGIVQRIHPRHDPDYAKNYNAYVMSLNKKTS